jgi:hypothetical protein
MFLQRLHHVTAKREPSDATIRPCPRADGRKEPDSPAGPGPRWLAMHRVFHIPMRNIVLFLGHNQQTNGASTIRLSVDLPTVETLGVMAFKAIR